MALDPSATVLATLFDAASSDAVVSIVSGAGITIDWSLTDKQNFSHKTRKREYFPRTMKALGDLPEEDRARALTAIVRRALEQKVADLDALNESLAAAGWLYEGQMVPLVQGPTDPGAAKPPDKGHSTAVIVTALGLEADAVRGHLSDVEEVVHPQGTVYFVGNFDGARPWRVAFFVAGQGNAGAAAEVERAIAYFGPRVILLVGVAGALKDLHLGDVVAADKVYGYERGKAAEKFLPRPSFGLSTYPMIQRAQAEALKAAWTQRIRPHAPAGVAATALVAPIAAGEKVVAAMDSPEYKALRKYASDAVAVEMEGYGFLNGAHMNHGVNALVVRGISDRVEGKAEADAAGSQPRAASHAAAFAFEVLANL
ncbi:MAG TPA: hypothetical protein VI485_09085 [Vicinamibacterales bacterium]|nr:hypothetical protein [Vicinamibacterales bacterium]